MDNIKEWIRTNDICTNISSHAMNKKHDFNDKYNQQCILKVSR